MGLGRRIDLQTYCGGGRLRWYGLLVVLKVVLVGSGGSWGCVVSS
jgi:hypothetical protein